MSLVANLIAVVAAIGADIKNIFAQIGTKTTTLTPGVGWTGTPLLLNKLGRVKVQGVLVAPAKSVSVNDVIAVIPAQYRPSEAYYVNVWYSGGTTGFGVVVASVEPSGNIVSKENIPNTTTLQITGDWDIE